MNKDELLIEASDSGIESLRLYFKSFYFLKKDAITQFYYIENAELIKLYQETIHNIRCNKYSRMFHMAFSDTFDYNKKIVYTTSLSYFSEFIFICYLLDFDTVHSLHLLTDTRIAGKLYDMPKRSISYSDCHLLRYIEEAKSLIANFMSDITYKNRHISNPNVSCELLWL